MVFIFAFWIFNLRNVWRVNEQAPSASSQDWAQLKTDFNKTINDLETRLHQDADKQAAADLASSTLNNLIKSTEKIASSSTSSTVTSTSTTTTPPIVNKENKNCPAYVNCMPTVGGPARPCGVPPGCEGITTIAY